MYFVVWKIRNIEANMNATSCIDLRAGISEIKSWNSTDNHINLMLKWPIYLATTGMLLMLA